MHRLGSCGQGALRRSICQNEVPVWVSLEQELDRLYGEGTLVAFVIATFGTTDAFGIDDIKAIRGLLESKAKEYSTPVPQLHVDAAVGWVSCFLTEYDTKTNPLEIPAETVG